MIAESFIPYIAKLPTDNPSAVGTFIIILIGLCAGVLTVLKVVDRIKGHKPDASDLQTFVTKEEHKQLSHRVVKLEEDSSFQEAATQRALGRIEGKLDSFN